jgi:two-component system LytT family response regulator
MPEARLRAVIVDDEPAAREVVATLVAGFDEIVVVGSAGDGDAAVPMIREQKPDLLFLDVQMPGRDGFAVLDALGDDVPRGVIFVTAHDVHAVEAFERHALDYLLKPFGRPRFDAAVSRAIERLDALDALDMQRTLQAVRADVTDRSTPSDFSHSGESAGGHAKRIGVRTGVKTVIIETPDIDWVAADGDYVRIHCGKASHLASQRMHEIERLLDPAHFIRVHRSVIVNADRIRELHREADGGGSLVLTGGVALRVARSRWEALEAQLLRD